LETWTEALINSPSSGIFGGVVFITDVGAYGILGNTVDTGNKQMPISKFEIPPALGFQDCKK